MKKIIVILFSLCFLSGYGQQKLDPRKDPRNYPDGFVMLSENPELCARSFDISKYTPLDTTTLVVSYRKPEISEIKNTGKKKVRPENMYLYIGRHTTYFFSHNLYVYDSVYTARNFDTDYMAIYQGDPKGLYRSMSESTLKEVIRIPFAQNQAYCYEEPAPEIEWQIIDRDTNIYGYHCISARTTFRGRKWTAWFTPEIPLNAGPWKLYGLPGLILKAGDDSGEFDFEINGLFEDTRIVPWYSWRYKHMSRIKWLALERQIHQNPYKFSNPDNRTLFLAPSRKGDDRFLNETNWTNVPYTPIELE